jgi:hypothetical protein
LPTSSLAPGATPLYFPPEAAPLPAMVLATWVPWPWWSTASAVVLKFFISAMRPAKSGWVGSMPVSRTATVVPVPSKPACQAVGAPICGTLTSSVAVAFASSQTFLSLRARFGAAVTAAAGRSSSIDSQKSVDLAPGTVTATEATLARSRTLRAPAGTGWARSDFVAFRLAASLWYSRISGRSPGYFPASSVTSNR